MGVEFAREFNLYGIWEFNLHGSSIYTLLNSYLTFKLHAQKIASCVNHVISRRGTNRIRLKYKPNASYPWV